MIPRYANEIVRRINSDLAKLLRWQDVELAVIKARVKLGEIPADVYERIMTALTSTEPDIKWWKAKDDELRHDLNAALAERRRFIPAELQYAFHKDITSYDTEDPAQALAFLAMCELVDQALDELFAALHRQAVAYRHTVMLERTHGQWGKLRTFGCRWLNLIAELRVVRARFEAARALCRQSKLSGAMGNYGGGLTPELERVTLEILGLTPFAGATQIMPRVIYAPLAQSLQLLCENLGKTALDIRLGARSGYPICHEPFSKKQTGSSAMPHKKNTILTEQMTGMARMASGFAAMIVANIQTWEARAIEQSSVERVAWPDLFDVTLRMLSVMTKVIDKLAVYPDNMLREIIESKGTYASDEAKNFLAEQLGRRGIEAEVAYRIIQLAAFNVFQPKGFWAEVRQTNPQTLKEADMLLSRARATPSEATVRSIQSWIPAARLSPVDELAATGEDVERYNALLSKLFADPEVREEWNAFFSPSHLLKEESSLYERILQP